MVSLSHTNSAPLEGGGGEAFSLRMVMAPLVVIVSPAVVVMGGVGEHECVD